MSSANSAKVLSNIYMLDNLFRNLRKKIQTASYEPGSLGQVMMNSAKDYGLSEEKTLVVSDSYNVSSKEKLEPSLYDYLAHSLYQEVKKSSDQIILEDNDSLNSSYHREQSRESLELDGMTNEDVVNVRPEVLTPRSSDGNGVTFSFADRDHHQHLVLQTIMASSSTTSSKESSILESNVVEQLVKFCYSETNDQLKILQEVDELKFELQRLFTKTSDDNQSSGFSIKVTHFKGKVPSEKPLPLLGEAGNSSLQSKHERSQTVKCHCRPFSGGAPFVICCRCYKLLQLPVDFLVSVRRAQQLRCGGCSKVLKYTFKPRAQSTHQTTALK